MDLPNAKHREEYIKQVKELEEEITAATDSYDVSDLTLHTLQEKLDALAGKYQHDEKIGTARYKLYELQAIIYYYDRRDDKALEFINYAIDMRGSSYKKAEDLKESISSDVKELAPAQIDESQMSQAEKRKNLIGLEGWLALFIVGQILSLIATIFRFFSDGFLSSSDIDAINEYQAGLGDTLQTLTAFENLMVVIYIGLLVTTLVMLFRRRKIAKPLVIITLVFVAMYGVIDYAVASSIFNSSGMAQDPEIQSLLSKYAGEVGRNILTSFIWIPYFLMSKRVRATLTK